MADRHTWVANISGIGLVPVTVPGTTATADVDWERAWKLAVPVVVAAFRFTRTEAEGNADLTEDAHFGLLRALGDCGAVSAAEDSGVEATLWLSLPQQVREALGAAEYALMRDHEHDTNEALAMIAALREKGRSS